ncbi:MAG TPA: hypothetical protein VJZ93_04185 [Candidatus Nanoarchaeia archaeon]|nr:hypothetical protein [Candidatus Nanoarchaeia archaeon]
MTQTSANDNIKDIKSATVSRTVRETSNLSYERIAGWDYLSKKQILSHIGLSVFVTGVTGVAIAGGYLISNYFGKQLYGGESCFSYSEADEERILRQKGIEYCLEDRNPKLRVRRE